MNKNFEIILASASPRRKQLLAEAGYNFIVVPSDIDESQFPPDDLTPKKYAEKLVLAKAETVAKKYAKKLILAADTIIDFNSQIIGKPADAAEAESIVRKLFSSPHKVITAIAIVRLTDSTQIVASDITIVYPKKMSDLQIAEHIKTRSWQDKAGAYAVQENGDEFVEKIEGSLTNVMGLPMELLNKLLKKIKK